MPDLSVKSAIVAAEKKRKKEYLPREKKFLELYAKNNFKDSRACASKAGIPAKSYTYTMTKLSEDIKEIATALLLGAAPQAALSIISGVEGSPLSQTQLQAAKEVLDRVGVVKPTETIKHQHTGGIFLIPAKQAVVLDEDIEEGEYEEIQS